MSELEISIFQIDLALANLHILTPAEVNEAMTRYISSIDCRISCYIDLERYLVENECQVGNIHLSRRRQYIIRAEREWATHFLEDYNRETGYTPVPPREQEEREE